MLADVFRAASAHPADRACDPAELEPMLTGACEIGRTAWPALSVEPERFVRHLARHRAGGAAAEWLAQLRLNDLYLACACLEERPGAVAAFEREYMPLVTSYLVRAGTARQALDEVRQRVREKLLVGVRKIGDYSGRGTLAKWLEVVTLRVAIDLSRERRDVLVDESADTEAAVHADPELDYIKATYRAQFKQALQRAISALDAEQRNLLRLHFVDGVTLDQLSTLFSVHRATIARRIATARELILSSAKDLLELELKISQDEVESLLRLVRSRLDLSLSALLGRDS